MQLVKHFFYESEDISAFSILDGSAVTSCRSIRGGGGVMACRGLEKTA